MVRAALETILSSVNKVSRLGRLALWNADVASVIMEVRRKNLTYLETGALMDLAQVMLDTERRGAHGLILEAGCALGGSAIVLASAKSKQRPLFVYDVFGTIPPPSDKDGEDAHNRYGVIASGQSPGIGRRRYYGYESNLYEKVKQNFQEFELAPDVHNIHLIKGLYQDTLRVLGPVAVAHIDCDWYESVMTCLRRVEPKLVPGGTLVIDDYHAWSGCRRAVDEYFSVVGRRGYEFRERHRLHIVKL
jgi:asparagine synthase (glutamine-hydrolysing)